MKTELRSVLGRKRWAVKLNILGKTLDVKIEAYITVSHEARDVVNTSQVCYMTPYLI